MFDHRQRVVVVEPCQMHLRYRIATAAIASVVAISGASAQQIPTTQDTMKLPEIAVFGSRAELQELRQDLRLQPGSVSLIEPAALRATRQANLKDVLRMVPGVYVAPRFGAADEAQISIRGSGLRNNFHARGLNLLINGMPYRNSDGFTDFEAIELMTVDAMTVYKGGNAFRFGGGTLGGAINMQTKTGYSADRVDMTAEGGANGFFKGQLSSGGTAGKLDWYGSYTRTSLDGYRTWSDQGRDRVNAHVGYLLSPTTDIRAFYLFAHVREHLPGALTANELATDPTMAVPENVTNRWGRAYDLSHLGVQLRSQLSRSWRLELAPYFQYRDIDHPIFQVINQQSLDLGAELRLEGTGTLGGRENRLSLGVQPSRLSMDNRQFVNEAGEHGDLTKDQQDHAGGVAIYAEDALHVGKGLTFIGGLRFDRQVRRVEDHFLANGDQSDERIFEAVLPRVGAVLDIGTSGSQLYTNLSRSYEPPLLLELNSLTVAGFVPLEAMDAWQLEVGTRGRRGGLHWDLAAYRTTIRDEILNQNVLPFPGAGFTVPTYRNADRTRHAGLELGLGYARAVSLLTSGAEAISLEAAYTLSDFTFVQDSLHTGNTIPGLPRHVVQATLTYVHPSGLTIAPTLEWIPESYVVNSENTVRNAGWTSIGARVEYRHASTGTTFFVAGENLTDSRHAASVQVDAANGRSFEPADGRAVYMGVRWNR